MKIVIISDIKGESESVIPYGLNLAKRLEAEVDIIHTIDTRMQQGVPSMYADSQSITPGSKFSFEEIMKREKSAAEIDLDKILGMEASKLNYPLKINTIIQEGSIEDAVEKIGANNHDELLLVNSQPDNFNFETTPEIFETIRECSPALIVPPGMEFHEIRKVMLLTDFNTDDGFDKYFKSDSFLNEFNPLIHAVDVASQEEYMDKELQSKAWLQVVETLVFSSEVKTNILTGDDYLETIMNHVSITNPDLIMINKQRKSLFKKGFDHKLFEDIMEQIHLPILY